MFILSLRSDLLTRHTTEDALAELTHEHRTGSRPASRESRRSTEEDALVELTHEHRIGSRPASRESRRSTEEDALAELTHEHRIGSRPASSESRRSTEEDALAELAYEHSIGSRPASTDPSNSTGAAAGGGATAGFAFLKLDELPFRPVSADRRSTAEEEMIDLMSHDDADAYRHSTRRHAGGDAVVERAMAEEQQWRQLMSTSDERRKVAEEAMAEIIAANTLSPATEIRGEGKGGGEGGDAVDGDKAVTSNTATRVPERRSTAIEAMIELAVEDEGSPPRPTDQQPVARGNPGAGRHDAPRDLVNRGEAEEAGKRVGQLRAVFDTIDRNHDGSINVQELMLSLRTHPDVAEFMHLPMHSWDTRYALKEGGKRDTFAQVFQAIDKDGSKEITWPEFLSHFGGAGKGSDGGSGGVISGDGCSGGDGGQSDVGERSGSGSRSGGDGGGESGRCGACHRIPCRCGMRVSACAAQPVVSVERKTTEDSVLSELAEEEREQEQHTLADHGIVLYGQHGRPRRPPSQPLPLPPPPPLHSTSDDYAQLDLLALPLHDHDTFGAPTGEGEIKRKSTLEEVLEELGLPSNTRHQAQHRRRTIHDAMHELLGDIVDQHYPLPRRQVSGAGHSLVGGVFGGEGGRASDGAREGIDLAHSLSGEEERQLRRRSTIDEIIFELAVEAVEDARAKEWRALNHRMVQASTGDHMSQRRRRTATVTNNMSLAMFSEGGAGSEGAEGCINHEEEILEALRGDGTRSHDS